MIVEVSGAGFHNMGAQLMLLAARDQFRSWGTVRDVAIDFHIGTLTQRRGAGCASVIRAGTERRRSPSHIVAISAGLLPSMALRVASAYKPSAVDALVDASGFAFGDQWGAQPSRQKARLFGSYADAGKPVVLLPQAFGPFEKPDVAEAAAAALDRTDLIFARHPDSLSHLRGLSLSKPIVEMAPDFTNLFGPTVDPLERRTVVVIPNGRMAEMVNSVTEASYLGFLRACVAAALSNGFRVAVMAHEAMDRAFAVQLDAEFGDDVATGNVDDPLQAKALIGGAALVISSRYHGLVSALSQCVPAIGTSWSHKYAQLFADYGCEDGLWEVVDPARTAERLASWLTDRSLLARREALRPPAEALRSKSKEMWSRVQRTLTVSHPRGSQLV